MKKKTNDISKRLLVKNKRSRHIVTTDQLIKTTWKAFFNINNINFEKCSNDYADYYLPDYEVYVVISIDDSNYGICHYNSSKNNCAILLLVGKPEKYTGYFFGTDLSDSGGGDYMDEIGETRFLIHKKLPKPIIFVPCRRPDRIILVRQWDENPYVCSESQLLKRYKAKVKSNKLRE